MKIIVNENFFNNLDKNRLPQASGFNHLNEGIGEFAAGLVGGLATLVGSVMSGLGLLSSLSGLFVGSLAAFSVSAYKNMKYNRSEIGKANNIAIKDIVRDTANDGAYKSYLTAYLNKLGKSYNLYDIVETYNKIMGLIEKVDRDEKNINSAEEQAKETNQRRKDSGTTELGEVEGASAESKNALESDKSLIAKQEASAKMAFFSIVGVPQLNYILRKFYQTSGFFGGFTTGNKSLDNTFKNAIASTLSKRGTLAFFAENYRANVNLTPLNALQAPPDEDLNFETSKQSKENPPVSANAVQDGYSIPIEVFKQFFVAEGDMFFQKGMVNEEGAFSRIYNNAKETFKDFYNKSRPINPLRGVSNITNGLGLKDGFRQALNKNLLENPDDAQAIINGDIGILANHLYDVLTPFVLQYVNKIIASDSNFDEIESAFKKVLASKTMKDSIAKTLKADLPNFIKKK